MISILNCMIFCIVYFANCTYYELVYLIGTYIVQGFDIKLWKLLSTALTFIWDPASTSMKLRIYQVVFFTDTGFCSEILKYALFLFLALVDDTPWWKISINDRSDVYAKVQGQKSKVKVTEVKTQISCFRTITPVWFHIWWWKWCTKLDIYILFRSGAARYYHNMVYFLRSTTEILRLACSWHRMLLG